jgi:peptide/nickel transport system ATP-binding protein
MPENTSQASDNCLLDIKDLTIHYITEDGTVRAVNDLSLQLKRGETIGLVGETGAGKTTTALGIMQLVPDPPGKIIGGEINFAGEDIAQKTDSEMQKIRGKKISMIFQDPMTSLNPVIPVRDQIAEVILLHEKLTVVEAFKKAEDMLELVGIRAERAKDFPHQFSGGMRQRVVIAIALACNPELLIADEPTTALDVTIQAQVLELMKNLKQELNTSMIMITHDLGIVAEICDKVAIMYAGSVVEIADKDELFRNPKHPYTIGLFNSIPDIEKNEEMLKPIKGNMVDPTNLPPGCPFSPRCYIARPECSEKKPINVAVSGNHFVRCLRYSDSSISNWEDERIAALPVTASTTVSTVSPCSSELPNVLMEVKNLKKHFKTKRGPLHAVDGIDFAINRGETLGLVGESGCGKSTTGRVVLRLTDATDGEVIFNGENILNYNKKKLRSFRENAQIIFQDPFASLNPRMSVFEIIANPLVINKKASSKKDLRKQVLKLMDIVGLAARLENVYPHELDGGRRQRIGVARALALKPSFIVQDEPVSALDVSIQAQILNLMKELQMEMKLTYLFISHDIGVIKHMSNNIAIMYLGKIVEMSDCASIFKNPLHPYTRALLSAIPIPNVDIKRERIILEGDVPSPINPPPGCRFYSRCFERMDICRNQDPELIQYSETRQVACHLICPKND